MNALLVSRVDMTRTKAHPPRWAFSYLPRTKSRGYTMPQSPSLAEQLERIAGIVHGLAFDAADERRPSVVSDHLYDAIERTAEDLRATIRGSRLCR